MVVTVLLVAVMELPKFSQVPEVKLVVNCNWYTRFDTEFQDRRMEPPEAATVLNASAAGSGVTLTSSRPSQEASSRMAKSITVLLPVAVTMKTRLVHPMAGIFVPSKSVVPFQEIRHSLGVPPSGLFTQDENEYCCPLTVVKV